MVEIWNLAWEKIFDGRICHRRSTKLYSIQAMFSLLCIALQFQIQIRQLSHCKAGILLFTWRSFFLCHIKKEVRCVFLRVLHLKCLLSLWFWFLWHPKIRLVLVAFFLIPIPSTSDKTWKLKLASNVSCYVRNTSDPLNSYHLKASVCQ